VEFDVKALGWFASCGRSTHFVCRESVIYELASLVRSVALSGRRNGSCLRQLTMFSVTDRRQHGLIPLVGHAQLPHLGSVRINRRHTPSGVGRAGLEPATNGLRVPIRRAHDQAKRLGDTPHIACKTTDLAVASAVAVWLRYGCKSPQSPG